MAILVWTDALSIGIEVIDAEHQRLVALINELHDAIEKGDADHVLGGILDGLITYTIEHFAHEEAMFANSGYGSVSAHIREHEQLTRQVVDVQTRYRSGATTALSLELLDFLKNWLVVHIMVRDRKYAPFLTGRG